MSPPAWTVASRPTKALTRVVSVTTLTEPDAENEPLTPAPTAIE